MSAFLEPNNHPPPPNDRAWHAMVILVIIHIFTSKCETVMRRIIILGRIRIQIIFVFQNQPNTNTNNIRFSKSNEYEYE